MQEVRVTVPEAQGPQVVAVAFHVGIQEVAVAARDAHPRLNAAWVTGSHIFSR
jgi:hypothetical protein